MLALLQSVGVKHDDFDKAEKYKQLAKRLLPDTTAGGDRLFESVVALVSFFSACSGETAAPQFRNSWLKGYTKNDVAGWHGVKIDDDGSVLQIEAENCSLLGASTTRTERSNGSFQLCTLVCVHRRVAPRDYSHEGKRHYSSRRIQLRVGRQQGLHTSIKYWRAW